MENGKEMEEGKRGSGTRGRKLTEIIQKQRKLLKQKKTDD